MAHQAMGTRISLFLPGVVVRMRGRRMEEEEGEEEEKEKRGEGEGRRREWPTGNITAHQAMSTRISCFLLG